MAGIGRVGRDMAGAGIILGPGSPNVYANYTPVSLVGDAVAGHGPAPHTNPVVIGPPASKIFINNKLVTKAGTLAMCGHPVAPGSFNVIVL